MLLNRKIKASHIVEYAITAITLLSLVLQIVSPVLQVNITVSNCLVPV
jgi:hypothetical protein